MLSNLLGYFCLVLALAVAVTVSLTWYKGDRIAGFALLGFLLTMSAFFFMVPQ